jgi:outer membrane biogenesis lipoprotein LolB
MNRRGKFVFVWTLLLSVIALLSGCTTKSGAQAKAQQAYLAGQNAALRQQQAAQFSGVTVVGPVQNPQVS